MATTPVVPAPADAGASMSNMSLSDAIDALPVVTDDGAGESAPAEEPPALDAPEAPVDDTPVEDVPADEAASDDTQQVETQPDTEPEPHEAIEPDKISDNGKTYHFRAPKAKALLAARDFMQRVQEAVPNATIEELSDNYRRTVALDSMIDDHASGDPTRVDRFLGAWLNGKTNPQTLARLAESFPEQLQRVAPQVAQQLESRVVQSVVDRLYDEAARAMGTDQEGAKRIWSLAANLDAKTTGRFRDLQGLQPRDPLADERAKFEAERSAYQQQRQADYQKWLNDQIAVADQEIDRAVQAEMVKPLQAKTPDGKTIEEKLSGLPNGSELKEFVAHKLQTALDAAIKANPTWKRQYEVAEQRFKDNPGDKARLDALVTMMRQFAAPVIAKNAKAAIDAVSGHFLGQNAAVHARQQQAAQKREPVGTTPTPRRTVSQQLSDLKKSGATLRDDAVWRAIGL